MRNWKECGSRSADCEIGKNAEGGVPIAKWNKCEMRIVNCEITNFALCIQRNVAFQIQKPFAIGILQIKTFRLPTSKTSAIGIPHL